MRAGTLPASCVGGDEIRTFITQQATPVPLAVALPGHVAGPVDASRIEHTFVTELALPAVVTPVKVKHRRQNTTINHFTRLTPLPAL